jgi:hypothetical protein
MNIFRGMGRTDFIRGARRTDIRHGLGRDPSDLGDS